MKIISVFSFVFLKLSDLQKSMNKEDDGKESDNNNKLVRPDIIASTLLTICSVQKVDVKDAENIAMATLLPAHHPYVGKYFIFI